VCQPVVDLSGTSHVNYSLIKTYKLAEQTGSYMPNPTREEYGNILHSPAYEDGTDSEFRNVGN